MNDQKWFDNCCAEVGWKYAAEDIELFVNRVAWHPILDESKWEGYMVHDEQDYRSGGFVS